LGRVLGYDRQPVTEADENPVGSEQGAFEGWVRIRDSVVASAFRPTEDATKSRVFGYDRFPVTEADENGVKRRCWRGRLDTGI